MNIILYRENGDDMAAHLQMMVEKTCQQENLELYSELEDLGRRLRQPLDSTETIAVLVPADGEQLAHVVSFAELLDTIRIILVLPDQSAATIAMGHRLRPRFLSYRKGDCGDVAAVLEKMIRLGIAGQDGKVGFLQRRRSRYR
ncbi:MAG: hypothetical protein RBS57_01515 [Desulforhabdus sp.]|jgi:hypothetical protein|nr:hypothetical protein [Desulforhabdus sp.]